MEKTLGVLAAQIPGAEVLGDAELMIKDIEHDSRKVTEGTLFVCMKGAHVDGHSCALHAVEDCGRVELGGGRQGRAV